MIIQSNLFFNLTTSLMIYGFRKMCLTCCAVWCVVALLLVCCAARCCPAVAVLCCAVWSLPRCCCAALCSALSPCCWCACCCCAVLRVLVLLLLVVLCSALSPEPTLWAEKLRFCTAPLCRLPSVWHTFSIQHHALIPNKRR